MSGLSSGDGSAYQCCTTCAAEKASFGRQKTSIANQKMPQKQKKNLSEWFPESVSYAFNGLDMKAIMCYEITLDFKNDNFI